MTVKRTVALVLMLLALGVALGESRAARISGSEDMQRLVLVEYLGGTTALVSRHERIAGEWVELDTAWGYVGRTGMGKTREGDNRTPLGVYDLTTPFGLLDDPDSAQPYLKVTPYHYWCSTSGSEYYNQLVDSRETGREAKGADEVLIDYPGFYDYAMFIDYNAEGVDGRGAAIFLHCICGRDWTHGCIAVPTDYMRTVVRWAERPTKIAILDGPLEDVSGGVLVTTARAWVRSGPGTDSAAVDRLWAYQRMDYLGETRTDAEGTRWYWVRHQGQARWVSERQAQLIAP